MQFEIRHIPSSGLGGLIDTFYRRCICIAEFSLLMCVVGVFILHFSIGGWNSKLSPLLSLLSFYTKDRDDSLLPLLSPFPHLLSQARIRPPLYMYRGGPVIRVTGVMDHPLGVTTEIPPVIPPVLGL